jgi:hypothetical protein
MKVYLNDEKKICRPTASFKEGWTVLTGTIVLARLNLRQTGHIIWGQA